MRLGEGVWPREVNVVVTTLGTERQDFLVVFEERSSETGEKFESGGPPSGDEGNSEARIQQLEKELASSRAHLAVVDSLEVARSAGIKLNSLNQP